MTVSRIFHSLHLDISPYKSDRICYVILPEALKISEHEWLDKMALSNQSNMVVIAGVDWENDLTPWKAPGLKTGEFGGKAKGFFDILSDDLFVNIESSLKLSNPERYLVGVSLSGLFAVWASVNTKKFVGIGSVSGSMWYDGFSEWIAQREGSCCRKYYFSLGEKEKEGKNTRLAQVDHLTRTVIEILESKGADVFFEYNEGNHFGPLIERIEKAIDNILTV